MQVPLTNTDSVPSFSADLTTRHAQPTDATAKGPQEDFSGIAPRLQTMVSAGLQSAPTRPTQAGDTLTSDTRGTFAIFSHALQHLLNQAHVTITAPAEPRRAAVAAKSDDAAPTNITTPSPQGSTHTAPATGGAGTATTSPSSAIPPHAREFDRTGEIEWRPRLNNGKLSIIFRPAHASLAEKVEIFSADGKTLLATGKRGETTSDGRPTFDFDRAGAEFPDGAIVMMTFVSDKGVRTMSIPKTSERYIHGEQSSSQSRSENPGASNGSSTGVNSSNQNNSATGQSNAPLLPADTREFERNGEIEWRPRLNDGKLSILFRKAHETLADKVYILSPDGQTLLATGKKAEPTSDGRPTYEFDKPGSSFPDGAIVVMRFKNGEGTRKMTIANTAEKHVHDYKTSSTTNPPPTSSSTAEAPSGTASSAPAHHPPPSLIPAGTRDFEKTGQIEWRPRYNNGKLSIVFRTAHATLAERVQILSSDGTTVLASGTFAGKLSDGRPVYNFDKSGGDFPTGIKVLMTFKSNSGTRSMTIDRPSEKLVV